MSYLALDISTRTGWAYGDGSPGGTVFDTFPVPFKDDFVKMGYEYSSWVIQILKKYNPELILVETPVFRFASTYQMVVLHHKLHETAFSYKRIEISNSATKKHLTGNGNASKAMMIDAVKKRGFNVSDDNQADAIALILTHKEKKS